MKLALQRKKNKNSEILATFREEYGDEPMDYSSSGIDLQSKDQKDIIDEENERKDFEEERFIRLVSNTYYNYR